MVSNLRVHNILPVSELFCCFVFVPGSEFRRSELLCLSDPAVDEEEGWEREDILNDRELAEILSNGEGL